MEFILFADDTTFVTKAADAEDVFFINDTQIHAAQDWFRSFGLVRESPPGE